MWGSCSQQKHLKLKSKEIKPIVLFIVQLYLAGGIKQLVENSVQGRFEDIYELGHILPILSSCYEQKQIVVQFNIIEYCTTSIIFVLHIQKLKESHEGKNSQVQLRQPFLFSHGYELKIKESCSTVGGWTMLKVKLTEVHLYIGISILLTYSYISFRLTMKNLCTCGMKKICQSFQNKNMYFLHVTK